MSTQDTSKTGGQGTKLPPLALIAGPTASGKSDLALALAHRLEADGRGAVIVNADSAQLYADLPILSAGPSDDDLRQVRHRLYGAWDGATACSAADWATRAREVISAAHDDGDVPILVGGTGLYIRTLLDGIAPVPAIDPDIRREVRAIPLDEAHAALVHLDPERAAHLSPNDTARVTRALEVIRSTGRTLGDWQAERVGGIGGAVDLHPLILLPDRAALYARCDLRFARMLESGAVAEVEALLARGLDPALPVMRAIGVPEIAAFLQGDSLLPETLARGAQATRNYAKRQYTWLRHQPPADWLRYDPSPAWPSSNVDISTLFERLFHD